LTCCLRPERSKHRINNQLACLDIAANYGGTWAGSEHAPIWNSQRNWFEASVIEWNVVGHETAQHIEHRRSHNGLWRIGIASPLIAGTGKINDCFTIVDVNLYLNFTAVFSRTAE
jgi:hypothetical protein